MVRQLPFEKVCFNSRDDAVASVCRIRGISEAQLEDRTRSRCCAKNRVEIAKKAIGAGVAMLRQVAVDATDLTGRMR